MPRFSEAIRDARAHAKLGEGLMATLVGVDESRVRQLEAGEAEPAPDELEAYAQVFGVSMTGLIQGEAKRAPMTHLFYRSASEGGLPALEELVATDGQRVLGEFMRCARDIADLAAVLSLPPPRPLPEPPRSLVDITGPPPHGADRIADWLRAELGLGLGPIDSMQALLTEKLGIRILWVSPEELSPIIDGASTLAPCPSILVNLVEGPLCWWRTRMTLAHELCHLLCDREPGNDRFAIFSPHGLREASGRWRLFDGFERIERRAGAFAACFLAPAPAVRDVVGARDVTSEDAIAAVGKTFGLGRTTAINRLQHVFGLSKQTRLGMEARSASHWPRWKHKDHGPTRIGLRSGVVRDLALEAFAAGRIGRVRVREYLKLPLTEPLPEGGSLTAEQRAPVRRVEDTVRGVAQMYLQEDLGGSPGLVATEVSRVEGGFRVDVERRGVGAPEHASPCGFVTLSHDLAVTDATLERS
jgi:transcriptional regulator with XRE-family HTH domain